MKTKEELEKDILKEIETVEERIETTWSSEVSDATNRVAISNLYIALSNLTR